jgi:TonB-dependent starch-binding outer membrane protein SusC
MIQPIVTALLLLGGGGTLQAGQVAVQSSIDSPAAHPTKSDRSALTDLPARLVVEEVPLTVALEKLGKEAGVPFAFSPSRVAAAGGVVSCACLTVTVGEALDHLLYGTVLRYADLGTRIVIERRPAAARTRPAPGMTLAALPLRTGGAGSARAPIRAAVPLSFRTGTVMGTITEERTNRPIELAQVSIEGMTIGGLTDARGRYVLDNVPAGTHVLNVQRIGYRVVSRSIVVRADAMTVANFEIAQEALALDAVIVTGTPGGTQRRAIGNVVASLDADEILDRSPILQMDQLLGQRSPGLIMMPGTGQIGTGAPIRIRGISSITQGAEPIIYIDGVRMDGEVGGRGGAISRLNDLHPADIASLEIIKGPAAATLYGTEASNGVIQIITKRGASGRPQFDVSTQLGTNWMWNPEGRAGLRFMRDPDNPGELIGKNVYREERLFGTGPAFGYGLLQSYNLSMRGGTEGVRYFGSVSRNHDVGIVAHNWDKRLAVRGNVEALLTDKLTVTLATAYIQAQTRMSEGIAEVRPFRNLVWAVPANTAARGWRTSPPEEWDKVETRNDNDRTTSSLELRFQPASWSNHRLVAGLDVNSIVDWTLVPRMPEETMHFYGALGRGSKSARRGARRLVTVDYSGNANFDWRHMSFQPAIGFQYYKTESSFIDASGSQFPAIPITTISGGASRSSDEIFLENATVGVYVQQRVGWNDRAFVTAAVRADDNSAFGTEFDAAIYPKLSATWVISEEPFWSTSVLERLRLRAAWGAAGQQPGTFDASRLYDPIIGGGDQPGLSPASFGNPQLKPERSEELEVGFDASFLDGRVELEFTRYQRAVKDAIINRPLPLSSGFPGSQIVNVGRIDNWGNELGAVARLVTGRRFAWTVDAQLATTRNEIKSLGDSDVIFAGTQAQHREGYSIADVFMLRILSAEINDRGQVISATCDGGTGPQGIDPGGPPVPCSEAPQVWLGHSQPTWQIGIGNSFTLFNDLTLTLRVEGNGGHIHNATEVRATHNLNTTEAVLRANNPLLQAYRVLENDRTGVYDAGFLRLREASLRYILPDRFVQRIGANRGSVAVGMRNVAMLWTAQHGWSTPRDGHVRESIADMIIWDPETRGTGSTSVGFQQNVPQTASATVSLRLSF